MSALILLVLSICLLCWLLPKLDKPPGAKKPSVAVARTLSKSETQEKLYRLVYGDEAMVERLLKMARSRHPGKSEQWIWEKVIQDLERDRGYR